MPDVLELSMTKTVEELVTEFVHVKMKELPSSELMRVSEVMDILLDLQQELLTSSPLEQVPVSSS